MGNQSKIQANAYSREKAKARSKHNRQGSKEPGDSAHVTKAGTLDVEVQRQTGTERREHTD